MNIEDLTEKDIERFWSKVDKKGEDECWGWLAGNWKGYGIFVIKGENQKSHRISFMISNNCNIPSNICVCHQCDNPSCVNPKHLWLGTKGDNNKDRWKKGRDIHPEGEKSGRAKLTEKEILLIRDIYANRRMTQVELSKKFGVVRSVISSITKGEIWKCVGGQTVYWENPARASAKLNEEKVREIKILLRDNVLSQVQIADKYNINRRTISAINKNIIWKDIII